MKKFYLIALALLFSFSPQVYAQQSSEEEAVRQAVLDYVEGIYDVEPDRIERSVHPELAKRGFYVPRDAKTYKESPMNYEQLHSLAGRWNKDGWLKQDEVPKEVIIFEVLDQTATVKLIAQWGIDYMHLAKYDGKWQIVNVMWQSHPPKTSMSSN